MKPLIILTTTLVMISCNAKKNSENASQVISLKVIVAANTEALGGSGAIDKVEAIKVTNIVRERNFHDSIQFVADRQGRMRIDIYDLKSPEKERVFAESYDGVQGYQWSPDKGQEPASEKGTVALSHTPQYPGHIFQLKDMQANGHSLEFVEKEEIEGVSYHILELTLADGFKSFYYVDSETFLITRNRSKRALHVDVDSTEQLIEVQYLNHRKVNGLMKPFRVVETDLIKDTVLMESKILEYVFNPVVDPAFYRDLIN